MTVRPPIARDPFTGHSHVIQALRLGTTQHVNLTTSASVVVTNPVGAATEVVCVVATTDAYIEIGASPSASLNSFILPAGIPMFFAVRPSIDKIAAQGRSASGSLSFSELS